MVSGGGVRVAGGPGDAARAPLLAVPPARGLAAHAPGERVRAARARRPRAPRARRSRLPHLLLALLCRVRTGTGTFTSTVHSLSFTIRAPLSLETLRRAPVNLQVCGIAVPATREKYTFCHLALLRFAL